MIPESFNTRLRLFYQIRHRALFESYVANKGLEITPGTLISNRLLRMMPYCFLFVDDLLVDYFTEKGKHTIFYLDIFLQESRYYTIYTNNYSLLIKTNMNFYIKIFRTFLINNKNEISESMMHILNLIDSFFESKMQKKKLSVLKKEIKCRYTAYLPLCFLKTFLPDESENFYAC